MKDWRSHRIATLFGEVTVRLPRFLCAACNHIETGIDWPLHCRSTPELRQLQAHLSALMTYRVATGVLQHRLPVTAGRSPETFRSHTLQIGERLGTVDAGASTAAASAITVSLDSTFIRSREGGERHLEIRVGNVETAGGRQVFGAVAKAGTDISALIRLTQAASGLLTDNPSRLQAKAVIVEEVERLRWRIRNGKARNAKRSIDRIRKVMHVYREERSFHAKTAPSRRLWHALHDVDGYLRGQSSWLVNYAKRYRADLRVGTAITERTANFLVNRRMNKSQQMRSSRRGADLLLQTRCVVFNGALGPGFSQLFQPHANQNEGQTKAAWSPILWTLPGRR